MELSDGVTRKVTLPQELMNQIRAPREATRNNVTAKRNQP